jgi:hypothetical protein
VLSLSLNTLKAYFVRTFSKILEECQFKNKSSKRFIRKSHALVSLVGWSPGCSLGELSSPTEHSELSFFSVVCMDFSSSRVVVDEVRDGPRAEAGGRYALPGAPPKRSYARCNRRRNSGSWPMGSMMGRHRLAAVIAVVTSMPMHMKHEQ